MHSKNDNVKFASYNDANEVVTEFFDSLRSRYQINLETSMINNFIFDSVQFLLYKFHKVSFRRVGSYIDPPEQIKKKKIYKKSRNTDDKCFQYARTVTLSYEEIESHPERVSNIKLFINKYTWKGTNYPSKIDERKTFQKNNPTIALDIAYIKEKEIFPAYISKINWNCEKQTILLMI